MGRWGGACGNVSRRPSFFPSPPLCHPHRHPHPHKTIRARPVHHHAAFLSGLGRPHPPAAASAAARKKKTLESFSLHTHDRRRPTHHTRAWARAHATTRAGGDTRGCEQNGGWVGGGDPGAAAHTKAGGRRRHASVPPLSFFFCARAPFAPPPPPPPTIIHAHPTPPTLPTPPRPLPSLLRACVSRATRRRRLQNPPCSSLFSFSNCFCPQASLSASVCVFSFSSPSC